MVTLGQLAEAMGAKGPTRSGSYRAKCPAHEDRVESLSMAERDGKILLYCHAGCPYELVASKIREKHGLDVSGNSRGFVAASPHDGTPPVAEYVYTDDSWRPVAKKVRYEGPSGKTMRWMRWDGKRWVWGLDGVQTTGMLYRRPDVRTAVKKGVTIHVCEGEKACDLMLTLGMCATCQPMGAGPGKFTAEHAVAFTGGDVVVWADRDMAGEAYATEVAARLAPFARSVRIVQSATDGAHDDAWDHFSAGKTLEEAVPRPDLMPQTGQTLAPLSEFPPRRPRFLWEPYIPEGKLVLLDADGGTGKTTMCLAIAAGLSRGILPGDTEPTLPPSTTLYYGFEDDPGEYRVIYDACGGDPSKLLLCTDRFQLDDEGLANVAQAIRRHGAKLVVFDALLYYMSSLVKDANQSYEVGPRLAAMSRVAMETGASIVCIRHTSKSSHTVEAKHMGLGSVQFRNTARSQLVLRTHPQDRTLRVVTHEKGSILTRQGPPMAWRRRGDGLEWVGPIPNPFDKEEARADVPEPASVMAEDAERRKEARALLESLATSGRLRHAPGVFRERGLLPWLEGALRDLGLPEPRAEAEHQAPIRAP